MNAPQDPKPDKTKPEWIAFGERLSKAMKHAGLNALRLSKLADYDNGNLGRMLKGTRGVPNGAALKRLADACGVRVQFLAGENERMLEGESPVTLAEVAATYHWPDSMPPGRRFEVIRKVWDWMQSATLPSDPHAARETVALAIDTRVKSSRRRSTSA